MILSPESHVTWEKEGDDTGNKDAGYKGLGNIPQQISECKFESVFQTLTKSGLLLGGSGCTCIRTAASCRTGSWFRCLMIGRNRFRNGPLFLTQEIFSHSGTYGRSETGDRSENGHDRIEHGPGYGNGVHTGFRCSDHEREGSPIIGPLSFQPCDHRDDPAASQGYGNTEQGR